MRDRINIHHDELIRRQEDYYRKKRNHDNEIVSARERILKTNKEKDSKMKRNAIIVIRKITSHETVDQKTKRIDNRLMY